MYVCGLANALSMKKMPSEGCDYCGRRRSTSFASVIAGRRQTLRNVAEEQHHVKTSLTEPSGEG
jgi:hypothetical protein